MLSWIQLTSESAFLAGNYPYYASMLEHVGKIKEILSWLSSLSVLIAHGDVFLSKLEKHWDSKHLQNKCCINYSPIDQIPKKSLLKKKEIPPLSHCAHCGLLIKEAVGQI